MSRISQSTPQPNDEILKTTGKIYKGTINDAPMKLRVSSIPSKFQNVIYRNHKTPAFGNSRQRFHSHYENLKNLQPGPTQYQNAYKTQDKIFSKKGYGTMISNTKLQRLQKKYTGLPGPGTYNPKQTLLSRAKRSNSLALLSSKLQGHELFKSQLQKSKHIPGPGVYELRLKKSISQAHPLFGTVERFDIPNANEQNPGVGYYHYNTSSLQKKQNSQSPKIKYKKAGPQINEISYRQKMKVVKEILNSSNKKVGEGQSEVGPGAYNAKPIDTRIGFKIHQTSYDRFGQNVSKKIGQNKVKNGFGQEVQSSIMHIAQQMNWRSQIGNGNENRQSSLSSWSKGITSMFKSNVGRYEFVKGNINDPGKYSPQKGDKKSHLVNFERKWI